MLVVDIDRFKSVNETFGTPAGDEVLRATARRLVSVVTPGGAAFRTGGDEFMVVLGRHEQSHDRRIIVQRFTRRWAHARTEQDLDSLANEVEELRLENQRLTEAVMIDATTGLPNGVAFDADHLQLHARRSRSGERYALLLADIDHFHDYNDAFSSLRWSAGVSEPWPRRLEANVRQGDRAYSYGGEQFAVLLPGADLREAVVAAERIRARIEELAIEHPGNPGGVLTVTVGVLEAGFRHPGTKEVVTEVNSLLLDGKHAGRNRIVWPH